VLRCLTRIRLERPRKRCRALIRPADKPAKVLSCYLPNTYVERHFYTNLLLSVLCISTRGRCPVRRICSNVCYMRITRPNFSVWWLVFPFHIWKFPASNIDSKTRCSGKCSWIPSFSPGKYRRSTLK